jgi:hypothetical protein
MRPGEKDQRLWPVSRGVRTGAQILQPPVLPWRVFVLVIFLQGVEDQHLWSIHYMLECLSVRGLIQSAQPLCYSVPFLGKVSMNCAVNGEV